MIRITSFEKYEKELRLKFQRFINEAKHNALEVSDFLVCQQGGFYDWKGYPCIGLGEVGLNNLQKVNIINNLGPAICTSNDNYYKENGNKFFNGTTDFENCIMKVCNMYLDIWENEWFLRILKELVLIANGKHYDWDLDLSKLKDTGKGNFIRNEIIGGLDTYPYLQEVVKVGYNSNLRNAIGHSQYHIVQGGIWFDNFGRNKYSTSRGLSFEEWEKIIIYAWIIFRLIFSILYQLATTTFFTLAQETTSGGVAIMVPDKNGIWRYQYIYPDSTGQIWRFTKQ